MAFSSSSSFGFGAKTPATTTTTQSAGFGSGTSLFGTTPAASTGTSFGFGAAKTTASGGFTFGTPAASTPAFGSTATSSSGTGFGFGTATKTTASTGFGFGSTATPAFGSTASGTGFGFGSTAASTGSSLFGAGSGSTFGGFGAKTTASGFGFGTTTTQSTGFGAFGATNPLGTVQQQQTDNAAQNNLVNMGTAVSLPMIYGDERDVILAKWNQIQAYWGTGKGFFSQNGAVDFNSENPFCRFKAIGYSCIPAAKNEDGLVAVTFSKSLKEVEQNQKQVVDTLHKILGNKPNLSVCVEGLKPAPNDHAELIIYVLERPAVGPARRIQSTALYSHLASQTVASQLQSQLSVTGLVPKAGFSDEQMKLYLDAPPAGIDPLLWNQAKLDNPNPGKLIPVPMIGFAELLKRRQHQEQQTKLHQTRLDMITSDIAELQRKHTNTIARTDQYRRKHLELGHRVLKLMVRQEIYRKLGYGIQVEEEQLRIQLEAIMAELSAPMQFKGRLNELMSQIRMQHYTMTPRTEVACQLDPAYLEEIRGHLYQQQKGLQHLISIIKDDLEDLDLIKNDLLQDQTLRR